MERVARVERVERVERAERVECVERVERVVEVSREAAVAQTSGELGADIGQLTVAKAQFRSACLLQLKIRVCGEGLHLDVHYDRMMITLDAVFQSDVKLSVAEAQRRLEHATSHGTLVAACVAVGIVWRLLSAASCSGNVGCVGDWRAVDDVESSRAAGVAVGSKRARG